MAHRYVALPFQAEGFGATSPSHVSVALSAVSVRVDLRTGEVVSETQPCEPRRWTPFDPRALGDVVVRAEEGVRGPSTLVERRGWSARVEGELTQAAVAEDFLIAVVALPGERWDCIGLAFGAEGPAVRLQAWEHAQVASHGAIAACAAGECVHVLRHHDGRLQSASVSVPPTFALSGHQVFVAGTKVCILAGDKLLLVESTELELGATHRALPIVYEPLTRQGAGHPTVATVAFVVGTNMYLDHPTLRRLRVELAAGDPSVRRGDTIVLDDVREEIPGIFRVHAWHAVGGGKSTRPPPPRLELAAPCLQEPMHTLPAGVESSQSTDSRTLAELASQHGFRAPELLLRLLQRRDADPVFRRWLAKLWLDDMAVRDLTVGLDADPNLVAFCGLGDGDEYALYVYPPWCAEGREPPVVVYRHESNFAEFRASTFAAFFESELQSQGAESAKAREYARLVRDALDFPEAARAAGAAPAWLPLDSPAPGVTVDAALQREARGEVLEAERALLTVFLRDRDAAPRAAAELARIYDQLGWHMARAHLQRSALFERSGK